MLRGSRLRPTLLALTIGAIALFAPMGASAAGNQESAPAKHNPHIQTKTLSASDGAQLQLACWTTITQPGGSGTTVNVFYNNCASTTVIITPFNHAVAFDGTYTYVNECFAVAPGSTFQWIFDPSTFPPGDTNRWGVTNCMFTF